MCWEPCGKADSFSLIFPPRLYSELDLLVVVVVVVVVVCLVTFSGPSGGIRNVFSACIALIEQRRGGVSVSYLENEMCAPALKTCATLRSPVGALHRQ